MVILLDTDGCKIIMYSYAFVHTDLSKKAYSKT